MGDAGPRINGGVGFAVMAPSIHVAATSNSTMLVSDKRAQGLTDHELSGLLSLLRSVASVLGLAQQAELTISGDGGSHRGMGAGTTIRLACIEALCVLNGVVLKEQELVSLSERGGTSGIGIRTYFEGGMVFDIGHRAGQRQRPSSAWRQPVRALGLARIAMPDWVIGICNPIDVPSLTSEQERRVFDQTVPVPHPDVERALYIALFGIFASVAEGDLPTFISSIGGIQLSRWKSAEWSAYGDRLREVEAALGAAGAKGIGLSSIGPSLLFCADELDASKLPSGIALGLTITQPRNHGRVVSKQM